MIVALASFCPSLLSSLPVGETVKIAHRPAHLMGPVGK